jgi:hypothetical protein
VELILAMPERGPIIIDICEMAGWVVVPGLLLMGMVRASRRGRKSS